MPSLPTAGAKLELDVSQWEQQFKGVMGDASKLDALNPTVKVGVNDTDLKSAVGLANDLDTTVTTKVNVDDADVSAVSDQLDDIATIGAIDLAINIAGTAKEFFAGLGRFSGVDGILELDSALAMVEARTGKMIPDAERLINDLYSNGWGESRTQIAGVVAQAAQLGLEGAELEAAVLATLQVVSVTGGDATETLSKLDTAAKANGISFTETADLFIAGYQTGNDKADDLLDTLSEYGSTFKNFRLSAEGALALLDSGLNAGVFNTDVLADSVRELGIRLASIGTDEGITAAFRELDSLSDVDLAGLLDGYNAGIVTGDDMLQGIIDALGDVASTDQGKATVLGERVVGTQLEDMGVSIFSKLSTDADTAFGDIEGRAEKAGNAISDTLGVTIDTFLRGIEQSAVDLLSSDALDIDGKIDDLKKKLQEGMATLAEGGTLGDALEVTFGIEGVDTALLNIQRVFGQFVLAVLEVVAALQDPLGINDNDKGTRAEIARLAGQQLPFDLKVANPDEIAGVVDQAAARGVTDLGGAFNTAMDELISEGNFEQAKGLLDAVVSNADVSPEASKILADKWNKLIDDAETQLDPIDFGPQPGGKDPLGAFGAEMGAKTSPFTQMPEFMQGGKEGNVFSSAIAAFEEVVTKSEEATTNVATNWNSLPVDLDPSTQAIIEQIDGVAAETESADLRIATALTGNTVTQSFTDVMTAADASFPSVINWMDETGQAAGEMDIKVSGHVQHMLNLLKDLQFLSAQVATGVQQALALGAGMGGTTNNVTNNVSVTNNVPNGAAAAAGSYTLAASLRPGG